ncbi:hypothetical protein HZA86_03000 [Candidatus Uhrbacteria bacterium]|nr:hypothetical protein [Candidatus Uhrbacteria bacterium]
MSRVEASAAPLELRLGVLATLLFVERLERLDLASVAVTGAAIDREAGGLVPRADPGHRCPSLV